ncbi:hypothetical protein M011DRAFT_498336 [Sporormia fimetaria CBS 119925]|uniref:C2H2-type domain-containing protein n=1 Tax=Sporormia fimetaria CBS 119925 TaxID=1340428 RepID=A0A6A6VMS8_9PLEO|nr:hypothetical protein M011DRAFT_498336 [Sporormia fimetaria CBS 119925]
MSGYYHPDLDARPRSESPPLRAIRPKTRPSSSPEPVVKSRKPRSRVIQSSNPHSPRRRRRERRPKARTSQGDYVLLRAMAPDRLDIARLLGERTLASSDSDSESEDDDMDGRPVATAHPAPASAPPPALSPHKSAPSLPSPASMDLQATAFTAINALDPPKRPPPLFTHRDSVVEPDPDPATNTATSPKRLPFLNGPDSINPATSPNLGRLAMPQSRTSPGQTLPALQPANSNPRDGTGPSPRQEQRLPGFRQLVETAFSEHESTLVHGRPHRPSISSSTYSPTSIARRPSISSAISPGSTYAMTAASPMSANSETGIRQDLFLRTSQSLFPPRRPSIASDQSPFSATLHSASTPTDGYHTDGVSPGTLPTPIDGSHRFSIESRTLPLPQGALPLLPYPLLGTGGFKCTHPGCPAAPFQTQYLLNSHANVHSQSRPHYCSVQGCPRSEVGKGFKRKNEMIRHGLVHRSPGYVCPFCPEREHRYPRPDNLQRHVRVHHPDKDRDDPQLRDVLAQRAEGGSRGRRRRVGS